MKRRQTTLLENESYYGFSVSSHRILNPTSTKISMYILLHFGHNRVKLKHIILLIT